jgi:hypothetical protein
MTKTIEPNGVQMSTITRLYSDHPLVGKWVVKDDEEGVEYSITAATHGFSVTAVDQRDGEVLEISNVRWSEGALHFSVHVRSNGHRADHVLRLRDGGHVEDQFTAVHTDLLTRRK